MVTGFQCYKLPIFHQFYLISAWLGYTRLTGQQDRLINIRFMRWYEMIIETVWFNRFNPFNWNRLNSTLSIYYKHFYDKILYYIFLYLISLNLVWNCSPLYRTTIFVPWVQYVYFVIGEEVFQNVNQQSQSKEILAKYTNIFVHVVWKNIKSAAYDSNFRQEKLLKWELIFPVLLHESFRH